MDSQISIDLLNWHYNMKSMMVERYFGKKSVDVAGFQKCFRLIMQMI
jgi:hypothetical protein